MKIYVLMAKGPGKFTTSTAPTLSSKAYRSEKEAEAQRETFKAACCDCSVYAFSAMDPDKIQIRIIDFDLQD